ncbi:MAG: type II toxin-antitoxin system prevent-host-death family antitoxin [Candidatus Sedimenticola sp. (ex Thyasira tokunagai)]
MSALTKTEYQIISHKGKPAFVVVPIEDFERLLALEEANQVKNAIPNDVVRAHAINGESIIKAWREHLDMTQEEVASAAGMKQPALARIESNPDSKPRKGTMGKLAAAMGLTIEQLDV